MKVILASVQVLRDYILQLSDQLIDFTFNIFAISFFLELSANLAEQSVTFDNRHPVHPIPPSSGNGGTESIFAGVQRRTGASRVTMMLTRSQQRACPQLGPIRNVGQC